MVTTEKDDTRITAADILNLLAAKHNKDVFVPECKNGPSWFARHLLRMDAWAMRRSYSNACVWSYEIKVSRRDFMQDDKWLDYLQYCNQFYFVTPPQIVSPGELPKEAGLIWTSKNCARLYTKKKAPHRDIEIDAAVYKYILMSRAQIVGGYEVDKPSSREYWRRWLDQREADRDIGHRVSIAMKKRYDRDVTNVRLKQAWLEKRLKALQEVDDFLKALGLRDGTCSLYADVRRQVEDARRLVDRKTEAHIRSLHHELGAMLHQITEWDTKLTEGVNDGERDSACTAGRRRRRL